MVPQPTDVCPCIFTADGPLGIGKNNFVGRPRWPQECWQGEDDAYGHLLLSCRQVLFQMLVIFVFLVLGVWGRVGGIWGVQVCGVIFTCTLSSSSCLCCYEVAHSMCRQYIGNAYLPAPKCAPPIPLTNVGLCSLDNYRAKLLPTSHRLPKGTELLCGGHAHSGLTAAAAPQMSVPTPQGTPPNHF